MQQEPVVKAEDRRHLCKVLKVSGMNETIDDVATAHNCQPVQEARCAAAIEILKLVQIHTL